MPSTILATTLSRVRRRSQLRLLARTVTIAGAAFGAALVLSLSASAPGATALWIAVAAGAATAVMFAVANRRWSALDAARTIERTAGPLDNLVVTAVELDCEPRPIAAYIREEIDRQAAERLRSVDISRVVPLAQPMMIATAILAGCGLLSAVGGDVIATRAATGPLNSSTAVGAFSFKVAVSPPAYTKRPAEVLDSPVQVTVIAGSRVRIDTQARQGSDGQAVGQAFREWVAAVSEGIEVRSVQGAESRFLSVIVVPDAAPSLRVVSPGKDTAFATPIGHVPISVEAGDDLGLAALTLHFTKASGGGENVAFTEGNVPLAVERRSERQWLGRASLALETLGLADGDILVYRAIARDTNPNGSPVQSEQYLVEIVRTAQIADAGFSLPSEEKKYAISQQMVIYKTEQLLKSNQDLEQSRMIAIEQRMVRAEVVFLGGGDVQDEVEEAAHSHELAEGRMQNTGRVEMMRALNAMSRAEALLNDGRPREALVFEREALASLQRALDRRRYFLRTLPDRSRIDMTRRLSGMRAEARSWLRDQSSSPAPTSMSAHRQLMRELVAVAAGTGNVDAAIAARVAAIDPASVDLQRAAVALASARDAQGRREASTGAMQAITAHALRTLPSTTAIDIRLDALAGSLADELRQKQ